MYENNRSQRSLIDKTKKKKKNLKKKIKQKDIETKARNRYNFSSGKI